MRSDGSPGTALARVLRHRPYRPAIVAALGTGAAVAGYTTVDGVGVRASGTPLGYLARLRVLEGVAIPAYAYHRRRAGLIPQLKPYAARGLPLPGAHDLTCPTRPPVTVTPFQTCDDCDRAFRSPTPGHCRDCRETRTACVQAAA
ncbi:hypothetical protein QFZ71_002283 [Streptomyces sp. V2I9]|nr:hypothetical protein [Streptomyces sp. V2I9]